MLKLFIMVTGKFFWVFFLLILQQHTFLEVVKGNDKRLINLGLWTVMTVVMTLFLFKSSIFDLYQIIESILFLSLTMLIVITILRKENVPMKYRLFSQLNYIIDMLLIAALFLIIPLL